MEENQYNPIPESTSTESQNPEFQSRIDMTALKNSLDRVKAKSIK
jgi:MoxR-like ATPase